MLYEREKECINNFMFNSYFVMLILLRFLHPKLKEPVINYTG